MSSEMNEDKMQQVVRAVAKEKVSLKDEQKVMTILVLRKAFREVAPGNFDWKHFKIAEDVKRQYIGRLVDCNEFEKNLVAESAPAYNRVQPNELCSGREDGKGEGEDESSEKCKIWDNCPGVQRAIGVIFETAFEYGLASMFEQLLETFPQSYERLTLPPETPAGSLAAKVIEELKTTVPLKQKGIALLKKAYRRLATCLVVHHHKINCNVESSVEAMAYHNCCTTCMWAESFGFVEKSVTEEIEDQPTTSAEYHLLDGSDLDVLSELMHMSSLRKGGKEATSLDDKTYVDKQGNLITGKSFKTVVGENDMTGKMDVYDILGKVRHGIPDSVLGRERERE